MPATVLQNGGISAFTVTVGAINLIKNSCTGTNNAIADPTFAVTGLTTSMAVVASPFGTLPTVWADYTWQVYVPSANVLAVHVCNGTGTNEAGATTVSFNIRVIQ